MKNRVPIIVRFKLMLGRTISVHMSYLQTVIYKRSTSSIDYEISKSIFLLLAFVSCHSWYHNGLDDQDIILDLKDSSNSNNSNRLKTYMTWVSTYPT